MYRIAFALFLMPWSLRAADSPPAAVPRADVAAIASLSDAAWRIQKRWEAIGAAGSFVYDFSLHTWNSAGRLKESITRVGRVINRGGEHRTEILSATKDGRDVTAEARADEEKREHAPPPKRSSDDFPSPFDPRYRERYRFAAEPGADGGTAVTFSPRVLFDSALSGRALFDAAGTLRRVDFTLAKRPRFTRRLDFAIMISAAGVPERVESSGEASLLVWKRRFESTIVLSDVRAGAKENDAP